MHTGDVFVRYGLPVIDSEHGGSIDGMITGTENIMKIADANTKIIPGHGDLASEKDVADFKAICFNDSQQNCRRHQKGKTFKQITEEISLRNTMQSLTTLHLY